MPRASSLIGGHGVLAAFAAVEGEERGADAEAAGEIGEQRAILVVGVGDDHHDAGGGAEAARDPGSSAAAPRSSGKGRAKEAGAAGGSASAESEGCCAARRRGWRTQENQAGQSRARWGLDESVDEEP